MNTPFPHTEIKSKKRYDDFTVGRPGYWAMMLVLTLVTMLVDSATTGSYELSTFILGGLAIAQLVATAARCRDAGLNGWWCLTVIIPFVLIYFGCIRPDDHPKKLRAFEKLRVHKGDCV